MKRIIVLTMLIVLSFLFVSCQEGNRDEIPEVLKVGMDLRYPPFESTIQGTTVPEGISVDIARAFGDYLGVEVEIVNLSFNALIPALNSGHIDIIIASMSITEERRQAVNFTDPYFYFKIISLINKNFAEANDITESSTTEDLLAISSARYVGLVSQVSTSIPESLGKTVTEASDLSTAIESVSGGFSDILMMSANPVVDGFRANPNTTIVVWDSFQSSPIGMAVHKDNLQLLAKANEFIATFSEPEGLYEQLMLKWDAVILEQLGRYGLEFFINE